MPCRRVSVVRRSRNPGSGMGLPACDASGSTRNAAIVSPCWRSSASSTSGWLKGMVSTSPSTSGDSPPVLGVVTGASSGPHCAGVLFTEVCT